MVPLQESDPDLLSSSIAELDPAEKLDPTEELDPDSPLHSIENSQSQEADSGGLDSAPVKAPSLTNGDTIVSDCSVFTM